MTPSWKTTTSSPATLGDALSQIFDLKIAKAVIEGGSAFAEFVGDAGVHSSFRAASPARKLEFARGRACARAALAEFGVPPVPIGRGASGEPLWPAGFVGSISHSEQVAVAVAARASECQAVGVDVEREVRSEAAFVRRICSESELSRIEQLGAPASELALVVFSARESVQKLQFQVTAETLGLRSVEVLLEEAAFCARFLVRCGAIAAGSELRGHWARAQGFILTGVTLR